jgi:hypothetical protein
MSEIHLTPIPNTSVVFHSPGQAPLAAGAGQVVTATVKTPGNPNAVVHGQVTGTTILFHSPA